MKFRRQNQGRKDLRSSKTAAIRCPHHILEIFEGNVQTLEVQELAAVRGRMQVARQGVLRQVVENRCRAHPVSKKRPAVGTRGIRKAVQRLASPLLMDLIQKINQERGTTFLLVEQNAQIALGIADYGYIMENGRVVLDGPADKLRGNDDVREFYLGLSEAGRRKSFREIKFYKRRKRWVF